jgi:trigger factor
VTLTIHTEEDEQRQLKVTVEVPEERVQKEMQKKARSLARQINVPGFRKGKAPYNVIINRFGEEAVRTDAIEDMIQGVVIESLQEIDVAPYAQPVLDDLEMEPLVLKMTVPLEPTVALGDYRAIRKELEAVEVTQEALDEALEGVQVRHQVLEEVDRPAEVGDLITLHGVGRTDDEEAEEIWHHHDAQMLLDPERVFPGLPVVDNIVGMTADEEKEFGFTFPDDYEEEELAGRDAIFEVSVSLVQSRELPELTDELVQADGEFETVDELRVELEKQLLEQAERQAKSDLMDDFVDDLLANAELNYPPAAVESELDDTIVNFQNQVTQSGWKWEDYLQLQGETEASLKEEMREGAVERVRRGLVLRQFIVEEKLTVEAEDIDVAVEKRLDSFGDDEELRDRIRSFFTQGEGLESISNEVLVEKTQERIEAIVTGNAPDLEALEKAALEAAAEADELDDLEEE